jgi:hypothetical protein
MKFIAKAHKIIEAPEADMYGYQQKSYTDSPSFTTTFAA